MSGRRRRLAAGVWKGLLDGSGDWASPPNCTLVPLGFPAPVLILVSPGLSRGHAGRTPEHMVVAIARRER